MRHLQHEVPGTEISEKFPLPQLWKELQLADAVVQAAGKRRQQARTVRLIKG
jgi:hypothetical protein